MNDFGGVTTPVVNTIAASVGYNAPVAITMFGRGGDTTP
jgi:hypothetical protein